MTVLVPNTNIANTFDFMRRRVNHLANAMSFNAVTVNSNAAIGNAEVIGTFRANTVYTDLIRGGNNTISGLLTIATNTFINSVLTVSNNATFSQIAYANVFSSNALFTNAITVGAATLTPTVMTVNAYVGNWTGVTIPITRGGTGITTLPANGTLLIGSGNTYTSGKIAGEQFLSVTVGPGTINLKNMGVTTFASNTTNIRSGNIVLSSADITQALGYIPGSANAQLWIQVGNDLEYFGGNVAIGQVMDGAVASNATLAVRSTDSTKPVMFVNNGNTASNTQHAYINLGVANTGARMGLTFTRGANSANIVGGMQYNSAETLSFMTAGTESLFLTATGLVGIGTGSPSPNKGGNGVHVVAANPGVTLQSPSTTWHIGVNPNPLQFFGGARIDNAFGIYNDNNNSGFYALPDGGSAVTAASLSFVLNGTERVTVSKDNNTYFAGQVVSTLDMFATGFQTTSDYREKYDITTLSQETAVDRIKGIRPVNFKYNDTTRLREGFIAHELQEYIPVAVTGVKDGVVKQTVDKSEVVPTLVAAVQSLINRVEELEAKLREVQE